MNPNQPNLKKIFPDRRYIRHKRIILLMLLWLGLPGVSLVKAVIHFNHYFREAYRLTFELQYDKAGEYLRKEKDQNPGNKGVLLVSNLRDCMHLILMEDATLYKKLKAEGEIRFDEMEKEEDFTHPFYRFTIAEMKLQWAFVRFRYGDYLTGVKDVNSAWRLLTENKKLFPGFVQNYKSLGLLHVLIGIVPEEYRWAVKLAGFNGSLKEGLEEIEYFYRQTLKDSTLYHYRLEAMLVNTVLQSNFNAGADILNELEEATAGVKNKGMMEKFCYVNLQLHKGNSANALSALQDVYDFSSFPYLAYLRGLCRLYKIDQGAEQDFLWYCHNFKGNSFIKSSWQKLSYLSHIRGDMDKFIVYRSNTIKFGNDKTDEDRQALKEAKSGFIPDSRLLKSRLLFDGGYYRESYRTLLKADPKTFKTVREQLEFVYRLARIQHKQENYKKALYFYNLTIRNGTSFPYYFAANAALNAGLVCEATGERAEALRYFRLCLSMKNHEYRSSIEQKAKAGLQRLQARQ